MKSSSKNKQLPKDRPPLYDTDLLDKFHNNFEFYMNREYAYNRDKGKCRICKKPLEEYKMHCHKINEKLSLNKINKVPNLAWLCRKCDEIVHSKNIPEGIGKVKVKKILDYQSKLK